MTRGDLLFETFNDETSSCRYAATVTATGRSGSTMKLTVNPLVCGGPEHAIKMLAEQLGVEPGAISRLELSRL